MNRFPLFLRRSALWLALGFSLGTLATTWWARRGAARSLRPSPFDGADPFPGYP